ncbi:MAG: 2-iminoacetate synthase [Candidatus Anoxychlamydiales bacterium]|nr:2-iminoacetate synthase [Candidatus Anoxychlamydiales bacterium]
MIEEDKIFNFIESTKQRATSFSEIENILKKAKESSANFKASSEYVQGLSIEDAATLLNIDSNNKDFMEMLFKTAFEIKNMIYGNRIVLFAPLYVSNYCRCSCKYCGYRVENKELKRKILTDEEVENEVIALQKQGHKRLLMLMGDHPKYTIDDFIKAVLIAKDVKSSPFGDIRRINVEIPELEIEDFKKLKQTNVIGTYALFQETYHRKTYKEMHPYGPKSNYDHRLYTMDRALQAGVDDVGIGVLYGLYDYKFETLAMLTHAKHLDKTYKIGPHTISVPRLQKAQNSLINEDHPYKVSDSDFKKLVAIIRLSVPYTGMILSTREAPQIRRELYKLGISQISAGSKTEPGGYSEQLDNASQFDISDNRPTKDVIYELLEMGYLPSWCTACYRLNRTGKAFMEIAKKGEIHNCCQPNALLSFYEYLIDYGNEKIKNLGFNIVEKEITLLKNEKKKNFLKNSLERINNGKRDLFV